MAPGRPGGGGPSRFRDFRGAGCCPDPRLHDRGCSVTRREAPRPAEIDDFESDIGPPPLLPVDDARRVGEFGPLGKPCCRHSLPDPRAPSRTRKADGGRERAVGAFSPRGRSWRSRMRGRRGCGVVVPGATTPPPRPSPRERGRVKAGRRLGGGCKPCCALCLSRTHRPTAAERTPSPSAGRKEADCRPLSRESSPAQRGRRLRTRPPLPRSVILGGAQRNPRTQAELDCATNVAPGLGPRDKREDDVRGCGTRGGYNSYRVPPASLALSRGIRTWKWIAVSSRWKSRGASAACRRRCG